MSYHEPRIKASGGWICLAFVYAFLAIILDGLQLPALNWSLESYSSPLLHELFFRVNFFRILTWGVIPFLICWPHLDRDWFTWKRWKKTDFSLLGIALLAGAFCLICVQFVPPLRATYPSLAHVPLERRIILLISDGIWIFSWILGWEFLHRYFLIRPLLGLKQRHLAYLGLGGIVCLEAGYHILVGKPPLETFGMGIFSTLACLWSFHRANALLPFLAHLWIELSLILFIFLV